MMLYSCDRYADDFSDFRSIPPEGWGYYNRLIFDIVPEDSIVTGTLDLVVRHDNDYPFSNLYVEVSTVTPGAPVRRDTVSVELADTYGNWLGSGLGTSFQKSVRLADRFTVTDSARVSVRHVMRVDPVLHIEQIGLIFKADNTSN